MPSEVPVPLALRPWQALTLAERDAVAALHVDAQQVAYAGTVERAMAAAEAGPADEVVGLAIVWAARPVGFVVLSRGGRRPDWAPPRAVALTAMRIDAAQQGRGRGPAGAARGGRLARGALARKPRCWPCVSTTTTWPAAAPMRGPASPNTPHRAPGGSVWCAICRRHCPSRRRRPAAAHHERHPVRHPPACAAAVGRRRTSSP